GEWILITDSEWRWPAGGTVSPPVQWSVIEASEAIIGDINDPNGEFHLQTASVPLPSSTVPSPSVWWTQYFPEQAESEEGWASDPDGDGLPTLLEYAFGTHPDQTSSAFWPHGARVEVEGRAYWEWDIDLMNPSALVLSGEVSRNLIQWSSHPDEVEIIVISPTRVTLRIPFASEGRFVRFTARFAE